MTIEFTQQDLDYLAEKIAERLKGERKSEQNPHDLMDVQQVQAKGFVMSPRLYHILTKEFPKWKMKDLAGVRWADYKRVRGLGARTYNELCLLFARLNYKSGWNRLLYDHKTSSYYIYER